MNRRIFIDMDGTLARWKEASKTDELYEQGYYYNLEPNQKLIDDIKEMIWKGEDIYILSSFLNDSKYALNEKNQWLDKYLPDLIKEKRIFAKYGDNKSGYIKNGISSTDYLIDDYTKNLIEWKASGGTGIKYLNGINHTKGTWKGLMIDEANEENSLLKLIDGFETNKDPFNKKYLELRTKTSDFLSKTRSCSTKKVGEFTELLNEIIMEQQHLLNDYIIDIESYWQNKSSNDLSVHYKIRNKESKLLFDGYAIINNKKDLSKDEIKDEILLSNFHDKIDITSISNELRSFVDYVISIDLDVGVRLYADDLLNYFDMDENELTNKMADVQKEVEALGISDYLDIHYSSFDNKINYVDVSPNIIYEFEYSPASNEINIERTFKYTINGKDVVCELKYDNRLHGFAVLGYIVDEKDVSKENIYNVLSKEELSKIQGLLLNEINEIYDKEFLNNSCDEKDITDDMY